MALILMKRNATVTIAHSKTENLADEVQRADIVISAVGKPAMVRPSHLNLSCPDFFKRFSQLPLFLYFNNLSQLNPSFNFTYPSVTGP